MINAILFSNYSHLFNTAVALGHDEVADLIETYGSKRNDAIKSVDEDEELRKAAIKATSESLRSLELSDHNITGEINDLCISCPSRVSSPSVAPRVKSVHSSDASSPSCEQNPNKAVQAAPSILRGTHERVLTIPRTTSLDNFKNSTPAARRVSWADVLGQPGSLKTIVTYELSESEDEGDDSSDDSIDITDTSTTHCTTLSDEDDFNDMKDTNATEEKRVPSSRLPSQNRKKKAASIGRSLLGLPKGSLQTIRSNSNSSIEISDHSDIDDDTRGSSKAEESDEDTPTILPTIPHVDSSALALESVPTVPKRRSSYSASSIGRSLLGRPKASSQSKQSDSANQSASHLFNINPETLVPTIHSENQAASRFDASKLGRTLLGRSRRRSSNDEHQ